MTQTASSMEPGFYDALITKAVNNALSSLEAHKKPVVVDVKVVEWREAIVAHFTKTLTRVLENVSAENTEEEVGNAFRQLITKLYEGGDVPAEDELQENSKRLLAVVDNNGGLATLTDEKKLISDLNNKLPQYGLSRSELFSGGIGNVSLEHELRKEIQTADRIDLLVSFIKFSGLRLLLEDLIKFTNAGGNLRVITTTYMGATDAKACEALLDLRNTEVKVNYDSNVDRLHAKAYIFWRNSGLHTAYVGSSNISLAAITKGLEWNIKLTARDNEAIINKVFGAFETYWRAKEFELLHQNHEEGQGLQKLRKVLQQEKDNGNGQDSSVFFDIEPKSYQKEILEKLQVERLVHNSYKNLLVAATGTGKTIMAAFDFKKFKKENPNARFLFAAHRKEILQQSMSRFRAILRDNNFGEIWDGDSQPKEFSYVFASIPTLNSRKNDLVDKIEPHYYDYIVIDEVHHAAAESYQIVFSHFAPKVLLGLSATPERADGITILDNFNNRIAAEIRLPEAINRQFLCSFHYFCIKDTDEVDYSKVTWRQGKYAIDELVNLYKRAATERLRTIIDSLSRYLNEPTKAKAIGFCVDIEHANHMAASFREAGYNAMAITSKEPDEVRNSVRAKLREGGLYIFTVDLYNEGVDLPEIDTVLFLRPTESATVFLQQLGRGLRLSEGKECLTVLDYVAQVNAEFNFELRFRALLGRTNTSVLEEVESDFPSLPDGCHIVMEPKAKEIIIKSIKGVIIRSKELMKRKFSDFRSN